MVRKILFFIFCLLGFIANSQISFNEEKMSELNYSSSDGNVFTICSIFFIPIYDSINQEWNKKHGLCSSLKLKFSLSGLSLNSEELININLKKSDLKKNIEIKNVMLDSCIAEKEVFLFLVMNVFLNERLLQHNEFEKELRKIKNFKSIRIKRKIIGKNSLYINV
ncbi:MAG: hypothetical protein ACK5UE_08725 [Chitinophagales bacterium]|jgi:hypothetical protein